MKRGFTLFQLLIIVAVIGILMVTGAFAATKNPSPASPGYTTLVLPFYNATSSRTGAFSFKAPVGYSIKSATVTARAVSGTTPTLKVRHKDGSFVRYSGTLTTAGTAKDLTLATSPVISDEVLQSIDLITGGTSPVFSNITLTLFLKRL